MKDSKNKTILIGIGNCSRSDDGLGWAFLDEIKKKVLSKFDFVYKYQLNIEDAELIRQAKNVIFIDAFEGALENGFVFEKCLPIDSFEFSSHFLSPGVIVSLCENLYDSTPNAYVLKIQGIEWELNEGLSQQAKENLQKALDYFYKEIGLNKNVRIAISSN